MDYLEAKFRELEIQDELEILKRQLSNQNQGECKQTNCQINQKKKSSSNQKLAYYYNILNIQPSASLKEIKQAYRNLATVWHPDRFSQNLQLQKMAEEKIKEINEAYEKIKVVLEI